MERTVVGGDHIEPQPTCWCCGDWLPSSSLRLERHPEVGVCFHCVERLGQRKRTIERMTRQAPPGPWWRRLQFRAGFNRC